VGFGEAARVRRNVIPKACGVVLEIGIGSRFRNRGVRVLEQMAWTATAAAQMEFLPQSAEARLPHAEIVESDRHPHLALRNHQSRVILEWR
jgi:hypothetical protein